MLLVSINSCGARNFNENLCWRSNILRFTRGGTRLPKCRGSEYQNQYLPLASVSSHLNHLMTQSTPNGKLSTTPQPNLNKVRNTRMLLKKVTIWNERHLWTILSLKDLKSVVSTSDHGICDNLWCNCDLEPNARVNQWSPRWPSNNSGSRSIASLSP